MIGERTPRAGGVARVTFDGRTRTIHLHRAAPAHSAGHLPGLGASARASTTSSVRVLRGTVAVEGYAITARRR